MLTKQGDLGRGEERKIRGKNEEVEKRVHITTKRSKQLLWGLGRHLQIKGHVPLVANSDFISSAHMVVYNNL